MCPSSRREVRGSPNSNDVISEQSVSVNGTPRHVKDLRPALETTPSASDSEQESSESELLVKLATPDTGGSL